MATTWPTWAPCSGPTPLGAYDAVDRMARGVGSLHLAYPVLIAPPMQAAGAWTARSDAQDRPLRVNLVLDPHTGAVRDRQGFGQRNWVDQAVGVGVAAHEGQLFGWPNQLINLCTAVALLTVSVSAGVLWLRRRRDGAVGAPLPVGAPRFALGLVAIVLVLGVLLPLLGASIIVVFLLERWVLSRIPAVATWLGLRPVVRPGAVTPHGSAAR